MQCLRRGLSCNYRGFSTELPFLLPTVADPFVVHAGVAADEWLRDLYAYTIVEDV